MEMNKKYGERLVRIGLTISYYRKLKGLTQEELAESINKSRAFIGRIEAPNMYTKLSLQTLYEIADALNIPASKLLEFKDEQ